MYGLQFVNNQGIVVSMFNHFQNCGGVVQLCTTRIGGVSTGCYTSLNLTTSTGDLQTAVDENYDILANAYGFSKAQIVSSHQVHEDAIFTVDEEYLNRNRQNAAARITADGLITNVPGVVLTKGMADCVTIALYDPCKKAIANVHSGWRGTILHIITKAVEKMTAQYGTNPKDVLCGIGPAIGSCCYEVDEDLAQRFVNEFGAECTVRNGQSEKPKLDLVYCIQKDLQQAGIVSANIENVNHCTHCNEELYYSHRRNGLLRGGMISLIGLVTT